MRARILAGLSLSTAAVILASCNDHATPTSESGSASRSPISLAAAGNGCAQGKGHPVGTIVNTVTASSPWGVAVRDDGLAYFTQILDGGVGITSTNSQQVTGFIPTGYLPTGVAFSPDGSRAYVANQGDNTVTAINVASSQVIGSVSTGGSSPFSVQVSPDGTQLYVGNNDNTLLIVDTGSLTISKTVIVGFATNAFTVDGGGRMLYASSFASGQVTELDIFTGNVLRTFDVGGTPQGLAVNRKGTHLYVANEAGYLNDIDLTTGQIGTQIALVGGGFGIGVTPDDHEAWIAIPFSGKVQIFNLQQRRITGSLDVGGEPRRIAFSDQGKIGAVTNIAGYLTFVK